MARKIRRKPQRRWRAYRASPFNRHRIRVRWLLAQRTRMHNYLRGVREPGDSGGEKRGQNSAAENPGRIDRQAHDRNNGETDD